MLERNQSENLQKTDLGKVTSFGEVDENEDDSEEEEVKPKQVKNPFALNRNEYIFLKSEGIFL